jgi:hypothetical protein
MPKTRTSAPASWSGGVPRSADGGSAGASLRGLWGPTIRTPRRRLLLWSWVLPVVCAARCGVVPTLRLATAGGGAAAGPACSHQRRQRAGRTASRSHSPIALGGGAWPPGLGLRLVRSATQPRFGPCGFVRRAAGVYAQV